MFTINRARRTQGPQGKPLPTVFPELERFWRARFKQGEVHMIAAAPGVGKSVMSLNLAIRSGVDSLYLSPDTSRTDMWDRSAAIVTGDSLAQIELERAAGKFKFYEQRLEEEMSNVRFNFTGPITYDDLELELEAYDEVYGDYPRLLVLDNLRDIDTETEGKNHERYEQALEYLKTVARATGSCIIVLHHLTGKHNNGTVNAGQDGIEGQATKPLSLVLTLAVGGEDGSKTLKVAAVKNRGGKSDPSGETFIEIPYEPARAALG